MPMEDSSTRPPTLQPYLDNLPEPRQSIAGRRTTVPIDRNASATPTLSNPSLGTVEGEEMEDGDTSEDDDKTIEDSDEEEFERHYSRNSPASSESEPEPQPEDGIEGEDQQNGHGVQPFPSSTKPINSRLQRIASLPASAPSATRPHLTSSSSSTNLHRPPPVPPPLYPPFYNRPPTPLPPSPSLTSLLRPPSLLNRSTTSTRPTTPDSSDVETPLDTEAAVAHSARRAHPLPPTSPKVPTYEYYGFVLYLASTLAFIIYILWSYLPSPFLHALGITYYPNRWWSLAIPAWIVMLLIFIYVALLSYNVEYLTLPLNSLECLVDEAGNIAILDSSHRIRKGGSKKYVSDALDRRKAEYDRLAHSWSKSSSKRRRKRDKEKERDVRQKDKSTAMAIEDEWFAGLTGQQESRDLSWKQIWNEGTDAVMDVPIGGVCEILYGGDE